MTCNESYFSSGSTDTSDRLQQVFKPILSADICSQQLGVLFDRTTMLCAGKDAGGVGACNVGYLRPPKYDNSSQNLWYMP